MSSVPSVAKGAMVGAVAGAIGTVMLNLFQKSSLGGTQALEKRFSSDQSLTDQQRRLLATFEKAHMTAAQTVAQAAGTSIPSAQREKAAAAAEFAFGILSASAYGALAEVTPAITAGFGSVFGAVLFTGASEIVLPALRWVPAPAKRTATQHLGGLAGNIVYGLTTEAVRRLLRS